MANGRSDLCDQNTLRRLPVQNPVSLKAGTWIMCYDKNKHFKDADKLYQTMVEASGKLNMEVGEPYWIELSSEADVVTFEAHISDFLKYSGMPTICLIVLKNDKQYINFKNICYKYNVISQVVTAKTCYKANLSVASNILRQLNSKLGGDLYTMEFPKEIKPLTMLVGIDVCHQG
jgi:hypothetical protein